MVIPPIFGRHCLVCDNGGYHEKTYQCFKMFLLLFTIVVLYLFYSWITMKPRNFPPGPPCVPILGSLPFLSKSNSHFQMEEWRSQYGGVVGFVLGKQLAVAICEPKLVREVLKRDEFQGRPIDETLQRRSFNRRIGIMFSDGKEWQEQRRFTLRHLRDFGFGKTAMECSIEDEISELIEEIREKTVEVSSLFNLSSVNVLWNVMAGTRYKRSDPRLQKLMKQLTDFFRSGSTVGGNLLSSMFPILKYFDSILLKEQTIVHRELNELFKEVIDEHETTLDEENPRDFIDVYLTEMHNSQNAMKSTYDKETLMAISLDLFSAGSESVGNSVGFALLYMVLYPEVQAKIHSTIDSFIGQSRKPSLLDKNKMPFVEAVLLEIQRCNTIAPQVIPHRNFTDTSLNGYFIPKNTFILASLWCIMQDKEHWGDPENFRPARFIDEKGNFIKDEMIIPFGTGKRACPGESLARDVIFLFFTSLMQAFSVHLPPGHPKPSTVCLPGFTTAPQPFKVIFKSRKL